MSYQCNLSGMSWPVIKMLCAVISQVLSARGTLESEFSLDHVALHPVESHVHGLGALGGNGVVVTPTAVGLSVCIGDRPWGHFILMRFCRRVTILLAVINRVASSASAAEDMKNLMIWEILSIGPLNHGLGSFLEKKIFAPARVCALGTLR